MERHYFGLSTLLASVALLIWSIGETFAFPHGPNVSTGSNPVVSMRCGSQTNNDTYTVPSDQDLIVTDVVTVLVGNSYPIVLSGNNGVGQIVTAPRIVNSGPHHFSFSTGFKVPGGTTVSCGCSYSTCDGYWAGYLTHQ